MGESSEKEFVALQEIVTALAPLSKAEQARILLYVGLRYDALDREQVAVLARQARGE